MPIWTSPRNASTKQSAHVSKTRVTTITLSTNGLMPNSTYTLWCNGIDMSWACRTPGSRQGQPLTSDQYGSITILYSAELTPDYGLGGQNSSKYNSMILKNINGETHSIGISSQTLIGK